MAYILLVGLKTKLSYKVSDRECDKRVKNHFFSLSFSFYSKSTHSLENLLFLIKMSDNDETNMQVNSLLEDFLSE